MKTIRRKSLSGAADWSTQDQYNQGILLLVNRAKLTDILLRSRVADALQHIVATSVVGGALQVAEDSSKKFADFLVLGEYDSADKMSEEAANSLAQAAGITRDALENSILLAKQMASAPAAPQLALPPMQTGAYTPQPMAMVQPLPIYVPPAPMPSVPVPEIPAAAAPAPAATGVPWWVWAGAAATAVWLLMPKSDASSDSSEDDEGDEAYEQDEEDEDASDADGEDADEGDDTDDSEVDDDGEDADAASEEDTEDEDNG